MPQRRRDHTRPTFMKADNAIRLQIIWKCSFKLLDHIFKKKLHHNVASDDRLWSMFVKDVWPWLPLPHICSLHISHMGEARTMKIRGMRTDKRRKKRQVTREKNVMVHPCFPHLGLYLPLRSEGETQEKMFLAKWDVLPSETSSAGTFWSWRHSWITAGSGWHSALTAV